MNDVVKNVDTNHELKDSGIEWIGKIPKEWKVNKIKHCCYLKGRIGWQGLKSDEFIDEGPFLVTGTDFKNGVVNWKTCRHISFERYEEAFQIQLKNDDMLVTKDGTIGKVAIVKDLPAEASLNSGVFLVRNIKNMYYTKYLYYIMLSDIFWKYFKLTQNGSSTIVHLYQEIYKEFSFPFPDKQIQQAIANYLDNQVEKIDQLISEQNKAIENWKTYKQTLITEKVTKGLNPNVEMKNSGIELIGNIPNNWECRRLKAILSNKKNSMRVGPFGSQLKGSDFVDIGIPVYNQKVVLSNNFESFDSFISDTKFKELEAFVVEAGDVLVTTRGSIGKIAIVPQKFIAGVIHPCIIKFTLNKEMYLNSFLKYLFNNTMIASEQLNRVSNSTIIDVIYSGSLKNIYLPVPPISEQQQIVDFLDEKCLKIEQIIEQKQALVKQLEEYKQSLIYECVTGKRCVL